MNILAIDTSDEFLALALQVGAAQFSYCQRVANCHAQHILPQIELLLSQAKLPLAAVDLIAYNQGPGSFTGLRVGLGVALGLAYAINCQLMAIPRFALYAAPLLTNQYQQIIVSLDARLGQIYVAGLVNPSLNYFLAPQVIDPAALATCLQESNLLCAAGGGVITGPGIEVYREQISAAVLNAWPYLAQDYPKPTNLLNLALSGNYAKCSPQDAELLYVRNKVALDIVEQQRLKCQ